MFDVFKKGQKPETLADALAQLEKIERKLEEQEKEIAEIKKDNEVCVNKVEIVRFNPFSETGGDQSFSIALLNENNNGVVITSLFNHDSSRVYAKPIKDGKSDYVLSEEEKKVIDKAKSKQ